MTKKVNVVRHVGIVNFMKEIILINQAIADGYRFVAITIDTDFPVMNFDHPNSKVDFYIWMKANVDALQIVELGLSLSNSKGELPNLAPELGSQYCYYSWQFHFCDFVPYTLGSIAFLESKGIPIDYYMELGINKWEFAWGFFNSNLFKASDLTWITFHGAYHFGLMMKILTQNKLPSDPALFLKDLVRFFGHKVFDMKYMLMTFFEGGQGVELENLANALNVHRVTLFRNHHQAGWDSLLILQTFFKFIENEIFKGESGTKRLAIAQCMLNGLPTNLQLRMHSKL
ncbi:hypothetical protein ACFE04_031538 [Oxalis oulophora]